MAKAKFSDRQATRERRGAMRKPPRRCLTKAVRASEHKRKDLTRRQFETELLKLQGARDHAAIPQNENLQSW
jgi:hypothetical protein